MFTLNDWRKLPSGRYAGTLVAQGCTKGDYYRSGSVTSEEDGVVVTPTCTFTLGTAQTEA